jgi:hypothetical protein
MNAGAFIFIVLAVSIAGFIFSPLGKKALFDESDHDK